MNRGDLHIDTVAVFHNCVIVTGWTMDTLDIGVLYQNETLAGTSAHFRRDDLIAIFGERAAGWGFTLCAIAPVQIVDHGGVVITIGSERFAVHEFAGPTDSNGNQVLQTFRRMFEAAPGSILEIGSRSRSGNSYRNLFPECTEYVGIDIAPGPGVEIVCDAHKMATALNREFSYVFSVSVFEHILMPWKVALEMNTVMRNDAVGYIQSHHGARHRLAQRRRNISKSTSPFSRSRSSPLADRSFSRSSMSKNQPKPASTHLHRQTDGIIKCQFGGFMYGKRSAVGLTS